MPTVRRAVKFVRLLYSPTYIKSLLRFGVAAAVEHEEAIRLSKAATLVDIGANKGQFSLAFLKIFKDARVIAFEPLPEAAERYQRLLGSKRNVTLKQLALAEAAASATFYVTDRADSSSLLKPGKGQRDAFGVAPSKAIKVSVDRMDACISLAELPKPILVKVDVQGAELQTLRGCRDLEQADFIYVELSFIELYEGQPLFNEVSDYLKNRGFVLVGVFNQVATEAFGPTQADFLFRRFSEPRC